MPVVSASVLCLVGLKVDSAGLDAAFGKSPLQTKQYFYSAESGCYGWETIYLSRLIELYTTYLRTFSKLECLDN